LLDRLATERLAAAAEKVAAEGWKWIEVAVDFRYRPCATLRRLERVQVEFTPAEQATFDRSDRRADENSRANTKAPTSYRTKSMPGSPRSRWRLRPSRTASAL